VATCTAGSPTFLELLGRTKRVVTSAIEHADAPFTRVVEATRVLRSSAYTPIFQTLLTLQGAAHGSRRSEGAVSLPRLEVEEVEVCSLHSLICKHVQACVLMWDLHMNVYEACLALFPHAPAV